MEVLVATDHTFPVPGYKTEHGLCGLRLVFVPKPRRNVAKQCEKVEGCADLKLFPLPPSVSKPMNPILSPARQMSSSLIERPASIVTKSRESRIETRKAHRNGSSVWLANGSVLEKMETQMATWSSWRARRCHLIERAVALLR